MVQGSAHSFQLVAQVLFVQCPANSQRQLREMLPFNAVENAMPRQFRQGFSRQPSGHEEKRNFSHSLVKELQTLRTLPARAWALGYDDVVSMRTELLRALLQGRNDVGTDDELRFRQISQTVVYYLESW